MWYITKQQTYLISSHQSMETVHLIHIFSAGYMQICKCYDSAAFSHHLLPICTRFLYTTVECACGTLQTNRQIKSHCLTKGMATVQLIHISLLWQSCILSDFQCRLHTYMQM